MEIRDSRVLAAVAHPLRNRLLALLKLDGPATASVLAEKTGQAVGNVSHHLKVLSEAALVEEAPELARDRRERWWRRPPGTLSWSTSDFSGDPVAEVAEAVGLDRQTALSREWLAELETAPAAWRDAWFSTEAWLRLTPAELSELNDRVAGLFDEYAKRAAEDPSAERQPVFVFGRGFRAQP
ncbi:ArsR/SmtB family transcription factor [Amycolatopsis benzoatilytica]|uniref:ArsR/SmtB family transcription factor n=1 Tax=Amycolatopsis benzoatilytica TaxID=346045 RepID=UPI00036A979A|nr:helix-turn-helix domain-containing protein [Amycolatopsis benzoatilytica]